ncbi:MAG TPA: nuclear transport factor 2 family protein [Allosphingosinicella sp.]|uniref:nuclear transport factor 2 family protein n=1 Tax=Allosphingosinicella sp. TaxID=2823234 RepID=UPI002EDA53CD
MKTKRVLLAFAAAGLLASPGHAFQASKSADEQALRAFKTELWPRAYREGDEELLARLLATEFQMIDDEGAVSTRQEELNYVAKKAVDPPGRTFRFEIERLDIFENGTAVVSGTGHLVIPGADGSSAISYKSSNILIKRDGRWQAIASHVSGVKDQKPGTK